MPTSPTLILRSTYADIYVERETGAIIRIDYAAMGGTNEWDDVARFDPATFPADENETDVMLVGGWGATGYFAPQPPKGD